MPSAGQEPGSSGHAAMNLTPPRRLFLTLIAAVLVVIFTASSASAAPYYKRARRAAKCAYNIAQVIDLEVAGEQDLADAIIVTMPYKCLVVGGDAEDRYNDDPYGDHSLETINDVADAYRVDPSDIADVFCDRYGCE